MKTTDFDYELPKEFIAQSPAIPRDSSKLLIYDVENDQISHKRFSDISSYLNKTDCLVLNKTKVFPARIKFYFKEKLVEVFLLENLGENKFLVLVKPGKYFKINDQHFLDADLSFLVSDIRSDGSRIIEFFSSSNLIEKLSEIGEIPFPPYIKNADQFKDNYQTVFCDDKFSNSVAAPTAGLHFTNELIETLKSNQVSFADVVLSVGRGTFMPVKSDLLQDHIMHFEEYYVDSFNAEILNTAIESQKRIIAVGTTSVRVLESSYNNGFKELNSKTDLFIYPGHYDWKVVNALITNFHLPKSTLLMLVSSFLESKGVKNPVKKLMDIYEIAKKENYRFYSFGDSMFIF